MSIFHPQKVVVTLTGDSISAAEINLKLPRPHAKDAYHNTGVREDVPWKLQQVDRDERIGGAVAGARCCAGARRSKPPAYGLGELAASAAGRGAHLLLSRGGERPLSEFTISFTDATR